MVLTSCQTTGLALLVPECLGLLEASSQAASTVVGGVDVQAGASC